MFPLTQPHISFLGWLMPFLCLLSAWTQLALYHYGDNCEYAQAASVVLQHMELDEFYIGLCVSHYQADVGAGKYSMVAITTPLAAGRYSAVVAAGQGRRTGERHDV